MVSEICLYHTFRVYSIYLKDEGTGDLLVFEGIMMKRIVHQIHALREDDKPSTKKGNLHPITYSLFLDLKFINFLCSIYDFSECKFEFYTLIKMFHLI